MQDPKVVVGALARIEITAAAAVKQRLCSIDGVSTFGLGESERIGVLIESTGIDVVHDKLTSEVAATEGVLGVWPISLEVDDGSAW